MEHEQYLTAADDPELASAVTEAALTDGPPRLAAAPSPSVDLPSGYLDDHGVVHRTATVREMTGEDEEKIAVALKAKNPLEFVDETLMRCVEAIGPYPEVTKEITHRLQRGDRDALILAIRVATYGPDLEGTVTCPSCDEQLDITIDLATDISVRTADSLINEVKLRDGTVAELRFPNGGDQWELAAIAGKATLPEINTLLLSRCVLSIDGKSLDHGVDTPEMRVRKLGKADRATLLDYLDENRPGPRPEEVKVPCAACGVDIPTPVDLASLLL